MCYLTHGTMQNNGRTEGFHWHGRILFKNECLIKKCYFHARSTKTDEEKRKIVLKRKAQEEKLKT